MKPGGVSRWTAPELRRLAARCRAGETPDAIAATLVPPTTGQALRKAWRRVLGENVGAKTHRGKVGVTARHIRVWTWRKDLDLTYVECCERLGLEPTPVNVNKLRNGLIRFCRRNKMEYPRSARGSRHRGFRAVGGEDDT